jgi:TPR repeat protein
VFAQCNLGALYQQGLGVPQDNRQAMKWFLSSAGQGDSLCQYNLGVLYLDDAAIRDVEKARYWLGLAADQGHAAAQYKLGWLYSTSPEVTHDLSKAALWFRRAADQGEPFALFALGLMTANGEGAAQDSVAAYAFLSASARNGYPAALDARKELEASMTTEEIRRGQELARTAKPRTTPPEELPRKAP